MATAKSKGTITIRVSDAKRKALDRLATSLDADRSTIVNAALDQYLEHQRWEVEQIKEGLRQAEAGEFASAKEVREAFARFGA